MTLPRRLLTVVLLATSLAAQEQRRSLPEKHAKAGMQCQVCHKKENPSKAAVADDSCMVCHGDPPAMAEYTAKLDPNPHRLPTGKHPGPFPCTECHAQHRPATVKCLECHPDFKLKPR